MKTAVKSLLIAVPTLLLAACASSGSSNYIVKAEDPANLQIDDEYVSVVEGLSRPRGVKVVWVNPPKKRDTTSPSE